MAKKPLPPALAHRAATLAQQKLTRLLRAARADIALIKRRRAQIAESFYDIGEALVRLKRPEIVRALGHASFDALCAQELAMSGGQAERLIDIVTRIPRGEALKMGTAKAVALIGLANATPEADTPAGLLRKKALKLPSGETLTPRTSSSRAIARAAQAIRATKQAPGRRVGKTTTPEERAMAAELQERLRAAGLERARVTAVATKPGQAADVRIEGVPIAELRAVKRAI